MSDKYGKCPQCGSPGVTRDRSPEGYTTCSKGHSIKTKDWELNQWPTVGFLENLSRAERALLELRHEFVPNHWAQDGTPECWAHQIRRCVTKRKEPDG